MPKTAEEIRDLEAAGKISYLKKWNGSNRVERMEKREWLTQIMEFSGCPITEIYAVVFNDGQSIQAPGCKFYVEIA